MVLCTKRPSWTSKLRSSSKAMNLVPRTTQIHQIMVLPCHILRNTLYWKSGRNETCHACLQSYSTRRRVFWAQQRVSRLIDSDEKPSRWPFRYRRWVRRENICWARICQMPGENHNQRNKLLIHYAWMSFGNNLIALTKINILVEIPLCKKSLLFPSRHFITFQYIL